MVSQDSVSQTTIHEAKIGSGNSDPVPSLWVLANKLRALMERNLLPGQQLQFPKNST